MKTGWPVISGTVWMIALVVGFRILAVISAWSECVASQFWDLYHAREHTGTSHVA